MVGVAAVLLLKLAAEPLVDAVPPFLLFAAVVMAAAWSGGLGPGLAATILGAVAGAYFFVTPTGQLFKPAAPENLFLIGFVLEGIVISWLADQLRSTTRTAREQEHNLSLILEATSEGVWDWNVQTGEVYYSPRWIESLGYSPNDVPAHVVFWEGIVHPDDMEQTRAALRDHFEGRTPVYQCENRLKTKAGTYRWNFDRGRVVARDTDGKPLRMVGADTDITERKRAEEQLRASEALNRSVLASLSARIAIVDREGVILAVNDAWVRFGQENGASPLTTVLPGANYLVVCRRAAAAPDESARQALTGIETVLHSRTGRFTLEYPCPSANDERWFEMVVEPLQRPEGGAVIAHSDITPRKLAEQALRASETRFRRLAEANIVGVGYGDSSGQLHDANGEFLRILGRTAEELRDGKLNFLEMTPPEYQAKDRVRIPEIRDRGVCAPFEKEFIRPNGERVPVWMAAAQVEPEKDEQVAIVVDLSEQKRAEQAARAGQQQLQLIADALPVLIAYVDRERRYQFNNAAYERWFGISRANIKGQRLIDVLGPAAYEAIRVRVDAVLAGEPQMFESRLPYQGAGTRDVRVDYIPHRNEQNEVIGFYALIADETDRKRAEQALHRSEARLSAIVNTAADAIITMDTHGIIESVNPAAERMFGFGAAEMVGRNVAMLMPSPYREEHDRYLANYLRTGVAHIIGRGREVRGRRKDGSIFPVELSVNSVNHQGIFAGILRDITERKTLEREVLEAAVTEQRRIGQELHDTVGQELTGLGLMAAAMVKHVADSSNAPLASRIAEELKRVHQQVRDLSRGLVPVEVDPEGLRAALEELAARTTERSGIECAFDWKGPVEVEDASTATHLLRIAQEAVSNALRHGRPGFIRIVLLADEGSLSLEVQDDGVGIPETPVGEGGLGIKLMQYRAGIIGGTLTLGPVIGGGTLVKCVLSRRNQDGREQPGPVA